MIGEAESVILALTLTISLDFSLIAKYDCDGLFGSYLLICIFQQSKVKHTRTGVEAQDGKERLSRHLLRPQVQNQSLSEFGKFRSDYSDEVKQRTVSWA